MLQVSLSSVISFFQNVCVYVCVCICKVYWLGKKILEVNKRFEICYLYNVELQGTLSFFLKHFYNFNDFLLPQLCITFVIREPLIQQLIYTFFRNLPFVKIKNCAFFLKLSIVFMKEFSLVFIYFSSLQLLSLVTIIFSIC